MTLRYFHILLLCTILPPLANANHKFLEELEEPDFRAIEQLNIASWHPEMVRWIKISVVDRFPESELDVDWLEIRSVKKISSDDTQYTRLNIDCVFKNHRGPHGYDVQKVYVWVQEKSVISGYYPSTALSPL